MGVFFQACDKSTHYLMGVYGGDGVNMGVCRYRWECFGSFIEEGAFWGVVLFHSYLFTKVVYGCIGGP